MANSGNKQQGYGSNAPSYGDEQQSPPEYNAGPSTTTSSWIKSSSVKPTTTSTWVHTSTVTSSTHVTLSTGYSSSTTKGAKPKSSSSTGPAKYHTTLETSSKSSTRPTSSKGPKSQSSSSTSSTGPTKYHTTLSTSSKSSVQPTPTKGMSGGTGSTSSSTKNNGKSGSNNGSSGKSNSSTNASQVCPSTAFPQCCQLNVLGLAGVSCSNGKTSLFLFFPISSPQHSLIVVIPTNHPPSFSPSILICNKQKIAPSAVTSIKQFKQMCAESGLSANCCALPVVSLYFWERRKRRRRREEEGEKEREKEKENANDDVQY